MNLNRLFTHVLLVLVFLIIAPQLTSGQNVEFARNNFPDNPRGLREARKNLRQGEKLFEKGGHNTTDALDLLLKANEFNSRNSRLNFMIGKLYLNTLQYDKAEVFLKKASELNHSDPEVHFLLGSVYHLNYKFEEAIIQYNLYRRALSPQDLLESREMIDRRIAKCNNAIELTTTPERVFIDNQGAGLNSAYDDYSPLLSPDGRIMYFTSRRPIGKNPRIDREDNNYYENVFQAHLYDGTWETTGPVEGRINSRSHDATAAIAADGKLIVIYKGDKGGRLYESILKNNSWSRPKRLSRGINTRYQETSAAVSKDGNTLYLISDRPGGYGGKDIWVTYRGGRNSWSEPVNLGPTVNTQYDEESVFLAEDDKTLYFSSKGHNSMGGFDIFMTSFNNGEWSEPKNIGHPINSPGDDLFFVMSPDNESAYFASARPNGLGGSDIFKVTFLGPEKPVINHAVDELIAIKAKPAPEMLLDQKVEPIPPMTMLNGKVLDDETQEPLLASLELYDNEEEILLAQFQTNPETGAFFISLPGGKNYGIAVQAEGYLFHSENINVTKTNVFREIRKDIPLKKLEVGKSIVLNNIFFDTGQSKLRPESYAELGVLYKLLFDNENLKIEVSGHTDNVGSAALNQRLSENRARAVVEFLVERGIDQQRLSFKGYGFTRPVASNDTEEGRQLNRRTEFEIIEK